VLKTQLDGDLLKLSELVRGVVALDW